MYVDVVAGGGAADVVGAAGEVVEIAAEDVGNADDVDDAEAIVLVVNAESAIELVRLVSVLRLHKPPTTRNNVTGCFC